MTQAQTFTRNELHTIYGVIAAEEGNGHVKFNIANFVAFFAKDFFVEK